MKFEIANVPGKNCGYSVLVLMRAEALEPIAKNSIKYQSFSDFIYGLLCGV